MAKNTGKTQGSMIAAVQAGQSAIGSAITGMSKASATDMQAADTLEDIKEINNDIKKGQENMVYLLGEMFAFDMEAFRRERDRAREAEKERLKALSNSNSNIIGGATVNEGDEGPGIGKMAIGGLLALAAFAKATNTEDILRLPQQLKSIRAMATFARGIGTLGTLGFGPAILKNMKAGLMSIRLFPKTIESAQKALNTRYSNMMRPARNLFMGLAFQFRLIQLDFLEKVRTIRTAITENKLVTFIVNSFRNAFARIAGVFRPIIATVRGLFAAGTGTVAMAIDNILGPLKTVGKVIGKLFLPITLILGVIDGITGFMEEYGESGSIVDGIRGAVEGIVDGFIGTFVRLITDLLDMALSFLGLEQLGSFIGEFGEKITADFKAAVGGIVDIVTGIFTLDWERIKGGFGTLFSSTGSFFLSVLTAPIDMAVNFIRDIFGFGGADANFSLIEFVVGMAKKAWSFITGIFTFDPSRIMGKIFDIAKVIGAITSAGIAAAKAILPGGESPGEAFSRVYNEKMSGAGGDIEVADKKIEKVTTEDVVGNTTEITYKKDILNKSGDTNAGGVTIQQTNNNQQNNNSNSNAVVQRTPLHTSVDRDYEFAAYSHPAYG